MIKYFTLYVSGKLYFTSVNSKTHTLQEYIQENVEEDDLSGVLGDFCSKLSSNFEIYLFTDSLTLHSVDLSKQATSVNNVSLLEQFLLFELENVVDILPDSPVLKYVKDRGNIYHCLLTEESVVNDFKNICQQFGGKLAYLGHPAGFIASLEKKSCAEVFENTVHCQALNDQASFHLNSPLPTEYDQVQKWIAKLSLRNISIYNLSGKAVIPLEGNIVEKKISEISSKDILKIFKSKLRNSPILVFNDSKKRLKKRLPIIASVLISLIVFSYSLLSNLIQNKELEAKVDKKKIIAKNLALQKKELEMKIDQIPLLKDKISKLNANEIIYQNVKFWPGLLENLGKSFDESSQLIEVSSELGDIVSIRGITLNLLKMQKVVKSLEASEELKVAILDKSVKKNRINDQNLWNFTIKLVRNQ